MKGLFCIFALCVIVTLCLSQDVSDRINGGKPARKGDFTFTVRIKKNKDFLCSGMLISRGWILTRKDCIGKNVKDYKIVFSSGITRQVRYLRTDKKYDEIILARLNKKVLRTKDKVRPFDRFISKGGEEKVTECKTVGFSGAKINLKEVGVNIKWATKCGDFNKAVSFCFDATQGSICAEDNGSPIICKSGSSNEYKWYLVGLTSVKKECQGSKIEAIRLTYFKNYIFKVLRGKGRNGGNGGKNTGGLQLGEKCDSNEQCISLLCDGVCKINCPRSQYSVNNTCASCEYPLNCTGNNPSVTGTCIICPLTECTKATIGLADYDVEIYNKDECQAKTIGPFPTLNACLSGLIDGVMPFVITSKNMECVAYPQNCRLKLYKAWGVTIEIKLCPEIKEPV